MSHSACVRVFILQLCVLSVDTVLIIPVLLYIIISFMFRCPLINAFVISCRENSSYAQSHLRVKVQSTKKRPLLTAPFRGLHSSTSASILPCPCVTNPGPLHYIHKPPLWSFSRACPILSLLCSCPNHLNFFKSVVDAQILRSNT